MLFPPDCTGLLDNLELKFVESMTFSQDFLTPEQEPSQSGLEIPTETVVY
jgi:hypothetical protein